MAYLLPLGPWHPALDEPVLYKFEVSQTSIQKVEIELGFNHRGAEELLPRLLPHQFLPLISHICGKCSFANTLAAVLSFEKLADLEVSPRTYYLRTISVELERAASHLANIARCLRLMGINIPAARLEDEGEGLRRLLALTGNRVYDSFNFIGGCTVKLQVGPEQLIEIEKLRKEVYESVNRLLENHQLERRAIGIGIITPEAASEFGLVGPVGRASGTQQDTRTQENYLVYRDLDFRVVSQRGSDLYSRLVVRGLEALESLNLITQAARSLPEESPEAGLVPALFPALAEVSVLVESPRGQLLCYVATNEKGRLSRIKFRTPTSRNLPALPLSLNGQEADDAAPIIASLDFCFACGEK